MSKKSIYLIIGVVILSISCANLKYLNAFNGYHGKPKRVIEKHYLIGKLILNHDDDNNDTTFSFGDSYRFDRKGRILNHISFYDENDLDSAERYIYDYDKYGNRIKFTRLKPNGEFDFVSSSVYNPNGQRIFTKSYYYGKKDTSLTYQKIDTEKFTILKITKNIHQLSDCTIVTYNKNWEPIRMEFLTSTITSRVEYGYDDSGNIVEIRKFQHGNRLNRIQKRNFNENNDIVSDISYDIEEGEHKLKSSVKWIYKYDHKKNPIEELRFENNQLKWFSTFEYYY